MPHDQSLSSGRESILRSALSRTSTEKKIIVAPFYQAPFERIGEGVIFQTSGGDITFVNTVAGRILGLPRDRIQERSPTDPLSQAIHEDGSPFSAEGCPATVALATGRPVENVVMGILNPSSQQRVWVNVSATPVVLPGEDKPSRVYMIFHAIVEGRAAQKADGGAKETGP